MIRNRHGGVPVAFLGVHQRFTGFERGICTGIPVIVRQRHPGYGGGAGKLVQSGRIGINTASVQGAVLENAAVGDIPECFRLDRCAIQLLRDVQGSILCLQNVLVGGFMSPEGEIDAAWCPRLDDLLAASIQAHGGGNRNQHHGGENADVAQAHGILLHPIEHTGDGDKVPGFVVILLVFPQQLQKYNAAGGEQAIGAQHHQHHCHKEHQQCANGIFDGDGKEISCRQQKNAQNRQNPFGLGLPLPFTSAF